MLKKAIKKLIRLVKNVYRKSGSNHQCYICKNKLRSFTKYGGGYKSMPKFRRNLNMVGSDLDNFSCPYCNSHDRERHLYMFFDELNIWENIHTAEILHFAPETNLSNKIEELTPRRYIKGDFNPQNDGEVKIDATNIQFKDNSFDLLLCNHVLEHIPEYLKALSEIYRVIKPGGFAILQTPYSTVLSSNFEERNINTDELRFFFYGQSDHFRLFSEKQFFSDLQSVGFTLDIKKNIDFFDDNTSNYYGVNKLEDLVLVRKT